MTPGYTLVIGPVVPSRSCPEHREVVQLQAVYSFERGGLLMRSPKQVDPPIQNWTHLQQSLAAQSVARGASSQYLSPYQPDRSSDLVISIVRHDA